jgi:hypothetical protein
VGRVGIENLGDGTNAELVKMGHEAQQNMAGAIMIVGMQFQPGINVISLRRNLRQISMRSSCADRAANASNMAFSTPPQEHWSSLDNMMACHG